MLYSRFSLSTLYMCVLSHVRLFVIPWTVACQALLSLQARILGWVAIPTPGDLPDHGIICSSPASPQAYSLPLRHLGKPLIYFIHIYLCVCLCIYICMYIYMYACMIFFKKHYSVRYSQCLKNNKSILVL